MKARNYPIVFETEDSGAVSAYVVGLSVYAAADTQAEAERAIRRAAQEHLEALEELGRPLPALTSTVRMLRVAGGNRTPLNVRVAGPGALLSSRTSAAKAAAARANGLKGGRPRVAALSKPRPSR